MTRTCFDMNQPIMFRGYFDSVPKGHNCFPEPIF